MATLEVTRNYALPILGILLLLFIAGLLIYLFIFRIPPPPTTPQPQMSMAPMSMQSPGYLQQLLEKRMVEIINFSYVPSPVIASKGMTITWTNRDTVNHTVTQDGSGGFDSGVIEPGKTYERAFDTVGEFHYHCSIHPNMHGTVIVM